MQNVNRSSISKYQNCQKQAKFGNLNVPRWIIDINLEKKNF